MNDAHTHAERLYDAACEALEILRRPTIAPLTFRRAVQAINAYMRHVHEEHEPRDCTYCSRLP